MAEFTEGSKLNSDLSDIIKKAKKRLVLISPYIKIHNRLLDHLRSIKERDKLKIIIVYGKNEDDPRKSLSGDDFKFLREFPNLEIRYESRLHAKFYANENSALLSSMNLYDYSMNNNIEFGILINVNIVDKLVGNLVGLKIDKDANDHFNNVIKNSELKFKSSPVYIKQLMGITSKYTNSIVDVDFLSEEYGLDSLETKQEDIESNQEESGHCIRCKESIQLFPASPYCIKCFKSWVKYGNEEYEETYCHICGKDESSSKSKPACYKCYKSNESKLQFPNQAI